MYRFAEHATTSSSVGKTPLLTAHSWDAIANSFDRGRLLMSGAAATFGVLAGTTPHPAAKAEFTAAATAATAAAAAAELAAALCEQQAREARQMEREKQAAAERQAKEARLAAEAAARREAEFNRQMRQSERQYNDRVRSGEFMRSYRDPPTRGQMDRVSRTA